MRHFQVLCLLLALVSVDAPAAGDLSAADRAAIEKTHAAATGPVTANPAAVDWVRFVDAHYARDAIVMPPDGAEAVGRDAIIALFKGFPPAEVFKTADAELSGSGGLAYVRGTYLLKFSPAGQASVTEAGKYIEIWRKAADGSWRCVRDIWNADAPPK